MTESMNRPRRFPIAHWAVATGLALLLGMNGGSANAEPAKDTTKSTAKPAAKGKTKPVAAKPAAKLASARLRWVYAAAC